MVCNSLRIGRKRKILGAHFGGTTAFSQTLYVIVRHKFCYVVHAVFKLHCSVKTIYIAVEIRFFNVFEQIVYYAGKALYFFDGVRRKFRVGLL